MIGQIVDILLTEITITDYVIDNIIQLEFSEHTEDLVDRGKVFYSEF